MHQKQCTAHSGEKRPAASIWKNWVPCVFFCFGTCAIIKHKGKLIPQAKQLPVKIDTHHTSKVLRLPRKMTMDTSKLCCACHEDCHASSENVATVLRLPHKRTFDTLQNTSQCHKEPCLPRETKQRNVGNIQK